MFSRNASQLCLLGLLGVLCVGTILTLFRYRFEAGDIYPPYSTHRADPLGAKVLFESLSRAADLEVQRSFDSVSHLPDGESSVLFMIGTPYYRISWSTRLFYRDLNRWLKGGNDIVIAMLPVPYDHSRRSKHEDDDEKEPGDENEDTGAQQQERGEEEGEEEKEEEEKERPWNVRSFSSMTNYWYVEFGFQSTTNDTNAIAESGPEPAKTNVLYSKTGFPFHSALYFEPMDDLWTVICEEEGRPLIIERAVGEGRLILCADSFLFSNEAMMSHRETSLLSYLLGNRQKVWFDEYHFGIRDQKGIMILAREYKLHGLFFSLALLAGFFVWQNSRPLVPPSAHPARTGASQVRGRQVGEGLVLMLKRNIPAKHLLDRCVEEWAASPGLNKSPKAASADDLKRIIEAQTKDSSAESRLTQAYNTIIDQLKKREGNHGE